MDFLDPMFVKTNNYLGRRWQRVMIHLTHLVSDTGQAERRGILILYVRNYAGDGLNSS